MLPILRDFSGLSHVADEFFGRDLLSDVFDSRTGVNMPAVNIKETGDQFNIEVAAPGLNKKDFKINLENNVLTISSEKEEKKEDKDDNYMRREFNYTSFKRSFTLPNSVDADNIKAKHQDGVLHVEIPKKEEAKEKPPKQISIS